MKYEAVEEIDIPIKEQIRSCLEHKSVASLYQKLIDKETNQSLSKNPEKTS